jgi:hypothetical protein
LGRRNKQPAVSRAAFGNPIAAIVRPHFPLSWQVRGEVCALDRWLEVAVLIGLVLAVSVVTGLISVWFDRSRMKRRTDDIALPHFLVVRISILLFALFWVFLHASVVVFAVIEFDPEKGLRPLLASIFAVLPLTALIVWQALECWVAKFELVSGGLRYRSPFGRRGIIKWADVTNVYLADAFADWFRIRAGKQTVRVSTYRRGLYLLAEAILANVPSDRMGERTREALEDEAGWVEPQPA